MFVAWSTVWQTTIRYDFLQLIYATHSGCVVGVTSTSAPLLLLVDALIYSFWRFVVYIFLNDYYNLVFMFP